MSERKIFNFRPLVSIALFLIGGIVCIGGFFSANILRIVLSCLICALFVGTVLLKLIFAKEHKLFKVFAVAISFMLGIGLSLISILSYNNSGVQSGTYYFEGKVESEVYVNDNDNFVITLSDVKLTNVNNNEKISQKRVRLYLSVMDGRSEKYEIGEVVNGVTYFFKTSLYQDGNPSFYLYNKGITLIGKGNEELASSTGKIERNIFQKFKARSKEVLDTHLSENYSELGYTMMFGDKSGLGEDMIKTYQAGGTAHLLAVSGLHVGFVVALLGLFLKLFKANDKVKFFVISIIVLFYAFACGFTISVTRALIMTVVLLCFKMILKENDALSSLSFAAIIILIFKPFEIYDIGFQLSFSAVLGIILLAKPIERGLSKVFHKKFSSALAVTLAVFIGTLVVMLKFDRLSLFSIVANIFAIPIASFAFMFMFVFVLLGMLTPALGAFTYIFQLLMSIVTAISRVFGAALLSGANKIFILLFSFTLVSTIILASDYVFANIKFKKVVNIAGSVISVLLLGLAFI
ncbi:MAG: ComEC/Rec2 family competence protein [Clostridia bacterium]|nr:ComEC/Rec2 family competence protein [Clostridia bacterium]